MSCNPGEPPAKKLVVRGVSTGFDETVVGLKNIGKDPIVIGKISIQASGDANATQSLQLYAIGRSSKKDATVGDRLDKIKEDKEPLLLEAKKKEEEITLTPYSVTLSNYLAAEHEKAEIAAGEEVYVLFHHEVREGQKTPQATVKLDVKVAGELVSAEGTNIPFDHSVT